MTPNDTKPEKAEVSAVRPLTAAEAFADAKLAVGYLYRQGEEALTGYLDARAYQEGKKAAALQSSSSAEAELQDRVKVLEEVLWAIRAKMREEVEVVDEEDGPCSVFLDDDVVLRDIDNLLSAALNHGKGEDARAALTKDQGGGHGA